MAPVSDAMDRFRAGEPDAVRALYRDYAGAVHTVAISIVRDRELANDVVQQTFVKAWRAASTFQDGREVAPWLYSTARGSSSLIVCPRRSVRSECPIGSRLVAR